MASPDVIVGFGANYHRNMGPAVKTQLIHDDDQSAADNRNGSEKNDHYVEKEVPEMVECFELKETPWKDDDELLQIATGSGSSFFLTKSGKVYACGSLHGKVFPSLTQKVIQLPLKCVEIAAGRHFALARMEGGLAVCSWGAGHFGQLGLGGSSAPYMEHPTVVESLLPHVVGSPIAQVAAGGWHAMAVTQGGQVYSWGSNRNAQCGVKPGAKEPPTLCSPQRVELEAGKPPKVVKVATGRAHSVALDEAGKVYAWGACNYAQCGVLTRRRNGVTLPKRIESLSQVQCVDIAAGDTHTLALTGGGRVFSFGSGFEGQLGTGSIVQMNPKPKLVGDLDFVAIEAGREWKLQQKLKQESSVIDESMEWKRIADEAPEPAIPTSEDSALANVPKIVSIHAAGNSSMALSSNGHLYAWGCNDVANLGLPKIAPEHLPYEEPSVPPSKTSTLRQFHSQSFDSSHNIALPQRVDSLAHVNITSLAASPTFIWCFGKPRNENSLLVGRTLYELQEAKRQRSLRMHRSNKEDGDASIGASESGHSRLDKTNGPVADPREPKDASRTESNSTEEQRQVLMNHSTDSADGRSTSSLLSKSPASPRGTKKRFSLKAIGKKIRRASFRGADSGEEGGRRNQKN